MSFLELAQVKSYAVRCAADFVKTTDLRIDDEYARSPISAAVSKEMSTYEDDLGIPKFSPTERERRWARVRRLMARDTIDVIFVPPHTGLFDTQQANTRYLTGLGGNHWTLATVFPLDGEVTAFTSGDVNLQICLLRQDWIKDVRMMTGAWGFTGSVIQRLKELPDIRRLGISGLSGNTRFPEGTASHGSVLMLREQFPDVELVNATPLMEEARFVKSIEEIEFLRKGVELVESAIDVIVNEARPGVPENIVYAHMISSLVEGGGEVPAFILWSAGWPQPPSNSYLPTRRPLRKGDVLLTELQGRYGGCDRAGAQSLCIGRAPSEYHEMFALQQEAVGVCHDNRSKWIYWGDTVICTPDGAQRLGKRPASIIEIE